MKKTLTIALLVAGSATSFAGNNQKAVARLDKGETTDVVSTSIRAKVNESVLIGNSANAYAFQAAGTNQIFYDAASGTIAVIKRRGTLDADIPSGSGRIVAHLSTDQGATWGAGLQINGELAPEVFGRHPNVAILPSGEL
ncbi:MAG: hypothetical protein L6Q77_11255, partial [Bacteroidetes bacterium]|nr:hypothetical protein [Bacteroidota bacterium]